MARSSQGLSQQQQQTLRLNPLQVRFGRLLEMSAPEFEEEVARQLEENPALEVAEHIDSPQVQTDDEGFLYTETAEQMQRADYRSDDDIPAYRLHVNNTSPDDTYLEPMAVETDTPFASLDEQLGELDLSPRQRELARYIIGSLDDNGYLRRDSDDIAYDLAINQGLDVSPAEVRQAVDFVQSLDPAGICARNLRECLLLQLCRRSKSRVVEMAIRMIDERFDDFANRRFPVVKKWLRTDDTTWEEIMTLVRSLNPKPGALLESANAFDRIRHITPDFIIEPDSKGEVKVTLSGRIPDLEVSDSFIAANASDVVEAFVRERRANAEAFIDLAHRRGRTLRAVMGAIIQLQPEYFRDFRRSAIRPMVLRDVAALTGLDLSVVSRATASKYAFTPAGMIALKSLFSESVDDGGALSQQTVQSAIKAIIAAEDRAKPLSDEAIYAKLTQQGLEVSRRTVAKYREKMGIPVARLRRNQ